MWPQPLPPGRYPDPRGIPGEIYWDGQRWHFPPARRKTSPWKIVAIVCAVLVGVAVFVVYSPYGIKAIQNSAHGSGPSSQPTPAAKPPPQVKLNQEGRDGNLSFVVSSVDTAQQTVNVQLTVKNVGNRPTVFWTDNQRLWIGGRWFVPDKAAAAKAGTSSVKLDPGKSATVGLSFSVPAGNTNVDTIELHDASVSAGITVVPRPS